MCKLRNQRVNDCCRPVEQRLLETSSATGKLDGHELYPWVDIVAPVVKYRGGAAAVVKAEEPQSVACGAFMGQKPRCRSHPQSLVSQAVSARSAQPSGRAAH